MSDLDLSKLSERELSIIIVERLGKMQEAFDKEITGTELEPGLRPRIALVENAVIGAKRFWAGAAGAFTVAWAVIEWVFHFGKHSLR